MTTTEAEIAAAPPADGRLTDAALLSHFIETRDGAAFEALLRRHGPMVLGVCRRILRNETDAEDAFQATFIVLARKADSIRPRSMVGNWLHGVAYRTALKASSMNTRRAAKEREAATRRQSSIEASDWESIRPVLDQELKGLPQRYRSAIVMCDLEGNSLKEVARQLGCPLATVGTRVARGRRMLAKRLARRGVALSVVALAMLLSRNAANAAVPEALATATIGAAAISENASHLANEVMRSMRNARIGVATTALLAIGALLFAGFALARPTPPKLVRQTRTFAARLHDTWVLDSVVVAGKEVPKDALVDVADWLFDGAHFGFAGEADKLGSYRTDDATSPKAIDLVANPAAARRDLPPLAGAGIYKIEGRTMTICVPTSPTVSNIRPVDFSSKAGEQPTSVFTFQRSCADNRATAP